MKGLQCVPAEQDVASSLTEEDSEEDEAVEVHAEQHA